MEFEVENEKYLLIIVSDVVRDGIGIELWNKANNEMIAEIFKNDSAKKIEFQSENIAIPLEVIEKLISTFELKIGRKFH